MFSAPHVSARLHGSEMPMTAPSKAAHQVLGHTIDAHTRCVHYGGATDIIALKFKCCGDFYPCYECHDEAVTHAIDRWSDADLHERAVLCGACSRQLTIAEYLHADRCPACDAAFNPGCKLHRDIYFDLPVEPRHGFEPHAGPEDCTFQSSPTPERERQ